MDIQSLCTSERMLLAKPLWDGVLERSNEIEVTPEQVALLKSRLEVYKIDGDPGEPWKNARKQVQSN